MIAEVQNYKSLKPASCFDSDWELDWIKELQSRRIERAKKPSAVYYWLRLDSESVPLCQTIKTNKTHYDMELEKLKNIKELFFSNLSGLIEKHEGKYACVVEGEILIGSDKKELIKSAIKKFGSVSMYVNKIGGEKEESRKIILRPQKLTK